MVNRQRLIEDNINLVYFVVHTYYPTFVRDEDVVQCGMVGLCTAAKCWNNEGQFATYARKCILNEIKQEFIRRKKHCDVLSLDYPSKIDNCETTSLGESIVGSEDVDWVDIDYIRDNLNDVDQQVFDLKRSGMTNKEIAKRLGWSNHAVAKRLRLMKLQLEGDRWKCK